MELSLLGAIRWWVQALAVIFIICCIVLIIIVLLQKGRGGGLSAAFGGAGGQSAFGSKTGDVFTWATIVIVAVFLILAMILTVNYKPYSEIEEVAAPGTGTPPAAGGALPSGTAAQPAGTAPEQGGTPEAAPPPEQGDVRLDGALEPEASGNGAEPEGPGGGDEGN